MKCFDFIGSMIVIIGVVYGIGVDIVCFFVVCGVYFVLIDYDGIGFVVIVVEFCGVWVMMYVVDFCDDDVVFVFVVVIIVEYLCINVLIMCVGFFMLGNFEQLMMEEMCWFIDVNFWGMVLVIKVLFFVFSVVFVVYIIYVVSVYVFVVLVGWILYFFSKFVVWVFFEVFWYELEGLFVSVGVVYFVGVCIGIILYGWYVVVIDFVVVV